MSDQPTTVEDLPPSAKLVYKALEWRGSLTQKQLAAETMLPKRTVRFALDRLEGVDAVTEELYIPDARQNVYALREAADRRSELEA